MVPPSNGFRYLLTVVDRFTRWPSAFPLHDITTESVIDNLAHGWFASFGIPAHITTDRGSQFNSAVWEQLLRIWGIKHHQTTAYHPEANGMVERFHRRLKESLIALCQDERDRWFWKLPCTLLSIRTTLKPDIGASPADLVYGEGLALPGELLGTHPAEDGELQRQRQHQLANLRLEVERLQPTATSAHRTPIVHLPAALNTATHVFVRRGGVHPPLTAPYEGPYRVISRFPSGFDVCLPGRGTERIAISRLKPAHTSVDDGVNEPQDLDEEIPPTPPRPGRPPGRPPGPNIRLPRPNRRTSENNQRDNSDAAAPQPHRPTRPRRVRNIDEFQPPASSAGNPAPTAPVAPTLPETAPLARAQPLSFDDWLAVNAAGNPPPTIVAAAQLDQQSPPPSSLTRSKNLNQRPKPDVSALVSIMKEHLGLSPP